MQALHFQKPAPPKLAALIKVANAVPPEHRFEDYVETLMTSPPPDDPTLDASNDRAKTDASVAQMIDVFHGVIEKLPPAVRRWVFDGIVLPREQAVAGILKSAQGREWAWINGDMFVLGTETATSFRKAVLRYVELQGICEGLRGIARTAKVKGSDQRSAFFDTKKPFLGGHIQFDEDGKSHRVSSALKPFEFKIWLTIDEEGIVRTKNQPLVDAISEDDVEAARIRECKVCKRIFWAGRITKQCCSPACSNTFRVRRHRYKTAAEKAEHKHKRYTREEKQASAQPKGRTTKER